MYVGACVYACVHVCAQECTYVFKHALDTVRLDCVAAFELVHLQSARASMPLCLCLRATAVSVDVVIWCECKVEMEDARDTAGAELSETCGIVILFVSEPGVSVGYCAGHCVVT